MSAAGPYRIGVESGDTDSDWCGKDLLGKKIADREGKDGARYG